MTREQLLAVARSFGSLEEVTRWTFGGGRALVEVITQDEYTHDVVVAAPPMYLVFDTT